MKKLVVGALLTALIAGCGDESGNNVVDANGDALKHCDPLKQTGCAAGLKCTWFIDALEPPQYIGHLGCAPDGSANLGDACMFGPPGETGIDNCKAGSVCSKFRGDGPGVCKQICDQAGGDPSCTSEQTCVTYADLFATGGSTPAAAGVCDLACDPFTDNDFDGSASSPGSGAYSRRTTTCGSAVEIGCYGMPSGGSLPKTAFACSEDKHYAQGSASSSGLRHRAPCLTSNGCAKAGPAYFVNSCNQGYEPMLLESTEVTTKICVALCKPANCYLGNCGTNNANRAGVAGDGCRAGERVNASASGIWDGPTNSLGGGEHCRYMWLSEVATDGKFLPSKHSNTTGFCYSHAAYKFNKDGDANTGVGGREEPLPDCATLQDGIGSGANPSDPDYFGAAELGCVDTMHAGLGSASAQGKTIVVPEASMRKRALLDLPRPLYSRELQ